MTPLNWDKIYEQGREYSPVNQIWLDRILEYIENNRKPLETALDVGCGTGGFAIKLAQRNIHTTGIDLSEVALGKAREKAKDGEVANRTEFITSDIEKINQKDLPSGVDLVVCKLTYTFIEDKKEFLQKIKDILAEDGWLVISTPVLLSGYDISYSKRMKKISVPFDQTKEALSSSFSECDIFHKNYFEETGLEVTYIMQK